MRRACYPGSFDPVTNGHLDLIVRASRLYDELIVAVGVNQAKSHLFSADERQEMLASVTADLPNVTVDRFRGLTAHYCRTHDLPVIIKGLRAVSDFDNELQMAQMNHGLAGIETIFIATNNLYSFLSSSLVKEVAKYDGDVSGLVPSHVLDRLRVKLSGGQ
ncbi:MAG: pantetheine-phosphate adenylyltransferase [Mycobacteriales bacterium]